MKADEKGCSTCKVGEELWEEFPHPIIKGKTYIQYDYRHTNGKLFSTTAPTLEVCRKRRDKWLE